MTSNPTARTPHDRPAPAAGAAPPTPAGPHGAGAAPGSLLRLRGGADLVSALPVLIGYHPQDSLVLVGMGGRSGGRVGLTVRVDLPEVRADPAALCAHLVGTLLTDEPSGAVAVLVCGGPSGADPPDRDVAARVQRTLLEAALTPRAVLWASGTGGGARWACYDLPGQRCGCRGVLPDPATTEAAATAVRHGVVVLPDRAAVEGMLARGEAGALLRRAGLRAAELDRARIRACAGADPGPERTAEHHALLRSALDDAARCRLGVDDRMVLAFCAAFDDPEVRAEAVRCCLGPQAPHAEQLWAALFRAMPAPECAEPAALFAACALLRGDGALAGIAVNRALEAFPAHRLAGIVAAALRSVTGPAPLRRLLEQTYGGPSR